ncbi:hypothetical protein BIM11_6212 [Burkholderia pseudomallei]|nr:hypothetical protein BIM11_6212 [Burkholderia pseudomallei]
MFCQITSRSSLPNFPGTSAFAPASPMRSFAARLTSRNGTTQLSAVLPVNAHVESVGELVIVSPSPSIAYSCPCGACHVLPR